MSLRMSYLKIFALIYSFSAKWEFDGKPDFFRACLYYATLQLINVMTLVFFASALLGKGFSLNRMFGVFLAATIFSANYYSGRRFLDLDEPKLQSISRADKHLLVAYVVGSFVMFAGSAYSLIKWH